MLPDDAIQHVDYVVREEGEETILELLTMLNNGGDLKGVKGISYIKNGVPYHNPSRELLKNFDIIPDLSLVCGYQQLNPIKLFLQAKAHAHFLETSRGCPYPCKFCWRIGMKTMRHRSPEAVAEDLRSKTSFFPGFPNWLIILDSYFGVNRERTKAVLKEIIKSGVKSHSLVFARYEVAEDLEMLDLMKRAGVTWLFMGVESVDNKTLDDYDKKQTIEKVEDSIQRIRRYGIQVCAGFVLGSDNDTKDTVKQTLEWTQKSGAGWMMMNVLTEFPEGPERVISSDRIFQKNWDYYNLQFITHFPKNIKPSELQQGIYDAYRSFYSWRSILTNLFKGQIVVSFYQWFRRLMMKSFLQEMQAYIPYLKQVEEGRYDASGRFVEEREMELPRVA
ncbi:MAG: radical SAM protein [Deltaproteobacteria bacterium]|nr:radical SAM protein [Deltaproteobacteria bacterium]